MALRLWALCGLYGLQKRLLQEASRALDGKICLRPENDQTVDASDFVGKLPNRVILLPFRKIMDHDRHLTSRVKNYSHETCDSKAPID